MQFTGLRRLGELMPLPYQPYRSARSVLRVLARFGFTAALALALNACGGDSRSSKLKEQLSTEGSNSARPKILQPHTQTSPFPGMASAADQPGFVRALVLKDLRQGHTGQQPGNSAKPRPAQLQDAPLGAGLPSVGSLTRGVSALPTGVAIGFGKDFDDTLPTQRIQSNQYSIDMLPNGNGFANSAYAIYRFNLPGFEGTPQVETLFSTAPAADNLFIAVADFTTQSWRWMAGDAAEPVLLPEGDWISDSGDVLIIVLLRGVEPAELGYVRFGGNLEPIAIVVADPSFSDGPRTTYLTGYLSSDPDGAIVKYEWDLDGDGSFELDNADDPYTEVTVNADMVIRLRVTDDEGLSTETGYDLRVDQPGYDEVEPNDDSLTEDDLLPLDVFDGWEGNIGSGGYDGGYRDGYIFYVNTPRVAHFEFDGASGSGLPVTMAGRAVDSPDILLGFSTGTEDCRLHMVCETPGYYLLVIETPPNSGNMDYTLSGTYHYQLTYDEVEDNDSVAQPDTFNGYFTYFRANLGAEGYDGDGEDYFFIDAAAGEGFEIEADFPFASADIDMQLLASDGLTVLASSTTTDNIESLTYVSPAQQNCFLRCYLKEGSPADAQADYYLNYTSLGAGPTAAISVSPDSGDSPLTIGLNFDGSSVPLGKTLAQGEVDWNNDGIADNAVSSFDPFAVILYEPGVHTIRWTVRLTDGLSVSATDTVTVNGSLDEVEPNDELAAAQVLPFGPVTDFLGSIGPGLNYGGADDWYVYTANTDGTMNVTLNYEVAFPFMVIGLFDSFGELIEYDTSSDGLLQLSTPVFIGTPIYIQVYCNDDTAVTQGYEIDVNIS